MNKFTSYSRALLAALTLLFCTVSTFAGTLLDQNFSDSLFIKDVTRLGQTTDKVNGITSMDWAPGTNRLYVTVKGVDNANAHIQVINNGVLQDIPFYTFNTGVRTTSECGLLSLVFHPDWDGGTKQIYCFITVSSTEQRIVRFTETIDANGRFVASGSPTTIISGIPTVDKWHNGGGLAIAPDQNGNGRFLYWATGDNASSAGIDLDNTSLGSKIGRANLDGSTPTDGLNTSGLIWAYGYRNPFSMTRNPATGKLWVNAVGDDYEQIFVPTPGSWAGGKDFENYKNPTSATLRAKQIKPIIKYKTNTNGAYYDTYNVLTATRSGTTVTYVTTVNTDTPRNEGVHKGEKLTISGVADASFNGTVYVLDAINDTTFTAILAGAGTSSTGGTVKTHDLGYCITGGGFNDKGIWPASYSGNFFFGDFGSGRMMRVQFNPDNSVKQVDQFLNNGGKLIDVCFGPDGDLYYADILAGSIRRISYTGLTISTNSPLPTTTVGTSYSQALAVTGATAPNTWTVMAGALPSGLSLNTSTGAITGTPSTAGTFNFTVRVTDSTSKIGQKDFVITVNAALAITTVSPLPGGNVGIVYNQTFAATGGTGAKTWSVSAGTLPAGLTLNATSGTLTGTPTVAATSNFTVRVKDTVNADSTKAFALTTSIGSSAPKITSSPIITGNSGVPYTYDVNASGNPAPTYSLTASPAGMTINATSGVISWKPAPTVKGNFNVTVQAANGVLPNATQSFTINVLDYGLATRPSATPFLGMNTTSLPATLSATGVFSNVANLTAGSSMIPYSVNSPLWSDAASKARWMAIPNGQTITFSPDQEWGFPSGSVFVKHFELNTDERNPSIKRRLETRLLFVKNDGIMFGATYKWRADNSNADLLPDGQDENITITDTNGDKRTQTWRYPSRAQCLECHTQNSGGVLGIKSRQQNGDQLFPTTGVTDNQLRTYKHIGLFSTPLTESNLKSLPKLRPLNDAASPEERVRSYLDSNCAQCHRPGGAPAEFDARFNVSLSSQGLINGTVRNDFGVAGSKVVVPRDLSKSLMHRRLDTTHTQLKMPPLGRNVIDAEAVSVIAEWIGSLPITDPPNAPSSLIAVAVSSTQINLTWTDTSNIESGFEIERSPNGGAWTLSTTTAANATSYSNTGLTAATTYHYRLRAVNSVGASAYTGPVSTTTMSGNPTPTGAKINFQMSTSQTPVGYLADSGAVFGDRGNGYSYGWNLANGTTARDRNSAASRDQLYDTLQHLQKPENPNAVWEIALVNGTYTVRVVSGDPSYFDSVLKMSVEGQLAINVTPTTTQRWAEGTVTVNLTDGRLTITNASGAKNNKICFVDIKPVASAQSLARALDDAPADTWVFESAGTTTISTAMLFTKQNGDSLKLKANLPGIPTETAFEGKLLGVDVGGAVVEFTLDAKGRGRSKQGSARTQFDKSGNLIVQLSVRKGKWAEAWADGGIDNTLTQAEIAMPFVISFGDRHFAGTDTMKYVGRKEKSGRAK